MLSSTWKLRYASSRSTPISKTNLFTCELLIFNVTLRSMSTKTWSRVGHFLGMWL